MRREWISMATGCLIAATTPSSDAAFVGMEIEFNWDANGRYVLKVFARFNNTNDTVLDSSVLANLPAGNLWHMDFLSGGAGSYTTGTWNPAFVAAGSASADSWVTIGGNAADFSNSTAAINNWGSAGWYTPGIPAGAGWFNQNPPNLQGRVNGSTLRTLVAHLVYSPLPGYWGVPITINFNQGLGTPVQTVNSCVWFVLTPPQDADCDGIANWFDNCPNTINPDQVDCDGDGVGDACETDPDANLNGVRDNCESGPLVFSVPQNFASLSSAVIAATPGSIVRVAPGTYPERIDFASKAITVESIGGAHATILDGSGQPASVVSFLSGEGPSSVLRGFTIRNGTGGSTLPQVKPLHTGGGGILISVASPTIEDCIIEHCSAPWGGGVMAYRSAAVLRRCTVRNNIAGEAGGGIHLFRSYGAVVDDCLFEGNEAPEGAAIFCELGWATVLSSDFFGNRSNDEGSAILHRHANPDPAEPPFLAIGNCLVRDNESLLLGAAVRTSSGTPVTMSVADTEICDNIGLELGGLYVDLGGNVICDCPADINQSGTIDAEDLAYVLFAWGMPGSKAGGADINGDATVDANDLSLVLGSWGPCPN